MGPRPDTAVSMASTAVAPSPTPPKTPPQKAASLEKSPTIKAPDHDPFEAVFEHDDPENPKVWSRAWRWYMTIFSAFLVLNATFASSAPSGMIVELMEDFGMGQEVGTLTISLFITGYCVGPLLWGPLSEQYGRRPVFIFSFFVYFIFQIAAALSPNTGAILAFRFIGGTFAAAPLTNSGAVIADIWDADTRGKALALFTLAPFAGPAIGPTVAGYLSVAGVHWRWVFWILTIFAGVCWVMILWSLPETYAPVILARKAARLRKQTGDDRYWAAMDKDRLPFRQRVYHILARPWLIFFREPMLIAVTLYMSFVYGCLYLNFEAYPIVFTQGHHLNAGATGLMFLPIPIGGALAVATYVWFWNVRYERKSRELHPNPVPPEFRLEMGLIAGPLLVIAFFWFAWSGRPEVSFWAPMVAGGVLGFAMSYTFLALFNYIIDAYLFVAASALAASTIVRSIFGAVFPLFATQMYEKLGAPWASSLLGFIALALTPIPFVLIKWGPYLRRKSKYAPTKDMEPEDVEPTAEQAEMDEEKLRSGDATTTSPEAGVEPSLERTTKESDKSPA